MIAKLHIGTVLLVGHRYPQTNRKVTKLRCKSVQQSFCLALPFKVSSCFAFLMDECISISIITSLLAAAHARTIVRAAAAFLNTFLSADRHS